MAKVLFVDDEPDLELLAKQKFRKQIENGTFDLLFAQNGQEALNLIEDETDIAVVVTDVNMPEMDGLTLLENLKTRSPATKAIIVSAYGDTKTLRAAMNRGVFDFVTKPVDFSELTDIILRILADYRPPVTRLYTYQLLLATLFPKRIDLSYSPQENNLLWDSFQTPPNTIVLTGVSIIPSPIPLEIGICTAYGILKAVLNDVPDASLNLIEEKLLAVLPFLKAYFVVGQYHLESHVFSYKTQGEFKAHHIGHKSKTPLNPLENALLNIGDIITLEDPSGSHLSLSRIDRA